MDVGPSKGMTTISPGVSSQKMGGQEGWITPKKGAYQNRSGDVINHDEVANTAVHEESNLILISRDGQCHKLEYKRPKWAK